MSRRRNRRLGGAIHAGGKARAHGSPLSPNGTRPSSRLFERSELKTHGVWRRLAERSNVLILCYWISLRPWLGEAEPRSTLPLRSPPDQFLAGLHPAHARNADWFAVPNKLAIDAAVCTRLSMHHNQMLSLARHALQERWLQDLRPSTENHEVQSRERAWRRWRRVIPAFLRSARPA
jgi:hypothetical protein